MYCRVRHCRYSDTHVTMGHKCGKCGSYGHGVIECNNMGLINSLCPFKNDSLPEKEWCSIPNCEHRKLHVTKAHQCKKCKILGMNRFHGENSCSIRLMSEINNIIDSNLDITINNLSEQFIVVGCGMGSQCYIRNKNNQLLALIITQDEWGQYGSDENLDKRPMLNKFLYGLSEHKIVIKDIECPLCRTINTSNDIKEIKGLEEVCKVCMENPVQYFFGKCLHAVVCKECYQQL